MADSDTGTVKRGRGRPKGSKDSYKRVNKNGYTVSEKALAQRKKYGIKRLEPAKTPEEQEYNSRLIQHIMRVNEIAVNADRSDLLSLKSCFIAYLKLCQEDGFPVQNLTAYAAMGFYNNDMFTSFSKKDNPEIRAFCQWVRATCAMYRENMITGNKLNPVIGIFWQRNYDGLRNDTEQQQTMQAMDDDTNSGSSYKEKYKNLIGG